MATPAISLVTVTNGPALVVGSTFALRKGIGAVDPITAATLINSGWLSGRPPIKCFIFFTGIIFYS